MTGPVFFDPLFIAPERTRARPKEIFAALSEAWPRVIGGEPPRESVLLLVAQWGIETANGRACWNWNLGNVKRVQGEPWTWLNNVWEILRGQRVTFNPPHPQTHFRAFHSLEDGAEAYLTFLQRKYAGAWDAALSGDPRDFAHRLKELRYYTADEHDYGAALEARMGLFAHEVDEPDEGRASIDTSRPTVEKALQKLGYITTDYRAAVKAFQADHPPLAVDGIVGPRTSAALTTALLEHDRS